MRSRRAAVLITAAAIVALLVGILTRSTTTPGILHPIAGNPNGHFAIPAQGEAVDVSHPDHVVGNGSPASCTSAAVVSDVAAGGLITFNCGPKPLTITLSQTAVVTPNSHTVVLDGGGLVTLSGGGRRRILFSDTCTGSSWGACTNQPYPQISVQNITFADGFDATHQASCTADIPKCGYGGVDGGGAVYVEGGRFKAVDSRFIDNTCYRSGPDLGGAAIRALLQYDGRPVYITQDTFTGGRCSNGGALSSISVNWEILNSTFTHNQAIGEGANPAAPGTPGGGSGGAIYLDGANDRALIAGTVMTGNTANEGGGALFDVVDRGSGSLTFNDSHLRQNESKAFETAPGIYYLVDGQHRSAQSINSSMTD